MFNQATSFTLLANQLKFLLAIKTCRTATNCSKHW